MRRRWIDNGERYMILVVVGIILVFVVGLGLICAVAYQLNGK